MKSFGSWVTEAKQPGKKGVAATQHSMLHKVAKTIGKTGVSILKNALHASLNKGGIIGKSISKTMREDAVPANVVGSGKIEGAGVGPKGEPGVPPKKKRLVLRRGLPRG